MQRFFPWYRALLDFAPQRTTVFNNKRRVSVQMSRGSEIDNGAHDSIYYLAAAVNF